MSTEFSLSGQPFSPAPDAASGPGPGPDSNPASSEAGPDPIASVVPPSGLDRTLTPDDVERLFRLFLGRPVDHDGFKADKVASGQTVEGLVSELIHSLEFAMRMVPTATETFDGGAFRVPDHLRHSATRPRQVLLIGSCALDPFHDQIVSREPGTSFTRIVFNNGSVLPPITAEEASDIDFQLVQLPIRAVMPEHMYLNDGISEESAKCWFDLSKQLLMMNLDAAIAYARDHGVQTFVMNFLTPQQNPLGRLQDPYSYRNPVFYVSELNRVLWDAIGRHRDMFLIDAEQISACLGKRYIQDDSVVHLNHGSTLNDIAMTGDAARIEPLGDVRGIYGERVNNFNFAVYQEALSAFRSIRQIDAVKLVVFDLDDTLWRGVAAEKMESVDFGMTEGWPLGILEAASFLMKRGILIAIVSKNDEANVVEVWKDLYEHRFPLANFVIRKINWESKAQNVADIIRQANIGPEAVLFVDDNPVERAHVRERFPEIRVIDRPVAEWRRILLWSAELQPTVITQEGLERAATIRGKAKRDEHAATMDQASFLRDLQLRVSPSIVSATDVPRFSRCLELVNKTNQFNTNGRRWTEAECAALFASGGYMLALSVQDRYANYGLTCIAICRGSEILQYVMSCRVFGMELERAAIALASEHIRRDGPTDVTASLSPTGRNQLTQDLFQRLSFAPEESDGQRWRLATGVGIAMPDHVETVATD